MASEMVNDAIDDAMDDEEAEEETEDLVGQVSGGKNQRGARGRMPALKLGGMDAAGSTTVVQ